MTRRSVCSQVIKSDVQELLVACTAAERIVCTSEETLAIMLYIKRGSTSLDYMSEDIRLPSSAVSASSGSPRRLASGPIVNAGSRADSGREATTCNKRRAPLKGHTDAICVPKGAASFHANRSVLGPSNFNVAMMYRAVCRSVSLGRLPRVWCAAGSERDISMENVPLSKHASHLSIKTSRQKLERFL